MVEKWRLDSLSPGRDYSANKINKLNYNMWPTTAAIGLVCANAAASAAIAKIILLFPSPTENLPCCSLRVESGSWLVRRSTGTGDSRLW